jgi:hypothetical protein
MKGEPNPSFNPLKTRTRCLPDPGFFAIMKRSSLPAVKALTLLPGFAGRLRQFSNALTLCLR